MLLIPSPFRRSVLLKLKLCIMKRSLLSLGVVLGLFGFVIAGASTEVNIPTVNVESGWYDTVPKKDTVPKRDTSDIPWPDSLAIIR